MLFCLFTVTWEKRKLADLGKVYTGNTPSTSDSNNWSNDSNDHVWITPSDIDELTKNNSERHLSDQGWNKARKVPRNSVMITSIASIGKNTINTVATAFNQQINAIVPDSNNAYFILTSMNYNTPRFASLAGHTATAIINKTTFEKFQLIVPSLNEQIEIGNFFSNLDNLITVNQDQPLT